MKNDMRDVIPARWQVYKPHRVVLGLLYSLSLLLGTLSWSGVLEGGFVSGFSFGVFIGGTPLLLYSYFSAPARFTLAGNKLRIHRPSLLGLAVRPPVEVDLSQAETRSLSAEAAKHLVGAPNNGFLFGIRSTQRVPGQGWLRAELASWEHAVLLAQPNGNQWLVSAGDEALPARLCSAA